MTAVPVAVSGDADTHPAMAPGASMRATATAVAARTLRKYMRSPQLLVTSIVSGAIFIVLFRYIFGGAIDFGSVPYVDFLIPGMVLTSVLITGTGTAVGVAEDRDQGFFDRLRSLPAPRIGLLAGRALGDVTGDVARDPDFLLTPERLEDWESHYGRIPSGAWVLLRTGWSRRSDAASFINAREDGPHSPGFDARTSKVLAEDRNVLGVGVETIGTDAGQAGTFNPPFPNHATMHGAGKFGLASLRNLDQLPPVGAVVIAAPLKIVGGSGSPLRVLAIASA